jgi:hypothetical protein
VRRLARLLGIAVLGLTLSGCDLLTLLGGEPFPFDPDNPFPEPDATFTSGTATIELEGETLILDQLVGVASTSVDMGTSATWTNGDGWYLSFYGYGAGLGFGDEGYLSLDRLVDGEHWIIYDGTRCVTTTDTMGPEGLAGSATCRGLRWGDYFSGISELGFPEEIPGQPAFDAEIIFEALPDGDTVPA